MAEKSLVSNVQAEMMFVGCIYKKPEFLLEAENIIKSDFYFTDKVTKFLYEEACTLYKREQKFTQQSISVYMSEKGDRLSIFRQIGGYATIKNFMDLCEIEDFQSYYEELKKFALLREYENKGFNTEKIRESKKFPISTANDIYFHIRGMIDNVHTNIVSQTETAYISDGMESLVDGYLESPSMGALTPFYTFNSLFRGFRTSTHFSTAMLSNAGKTRFMIRMAAYNAFIQKNKTMILANEMSVEEIKIALLVTCINNKEFKELHKVELLKPEREIALGLYKNSRGEFISRERDENGDFTESLADYKMRLLRDSKEFRDVSIVSKWLEEIGMKNLAVIDVSSHYDDKSLEMQIRKNARVGFKYIFYDTMKSDNEGTGDWSAFKKTATILTEIAKNEEIFFYSSVKMVNEAENIPPLN